VTAATFVGPLTTHALASVTACGTSGTPSVTALQDPHFYVDTSLSPQLLAGYAGYTVNAGAGALSHLWLKLDGFTGGVVDLAAGQQATQPVPALPSNASSTEYFLLAASGTTTTPQTHTITLYNGRPGFGSVLCSRTFTYSDVVDTIKALANKVTGITSSASPSTATIGSSVTITVTGNTGTLGAGPANDPGVLSYTPDVLVDFPASAWQLARTEMTISPDGSAPPQTYVDQLRLAGASGSARPYTAKYTFRAVGPTTQSAVMQPVQYIASGTQVKHTDVGGAALYSLPTVSPIADLSMSRSIVTPSSGTVAAGGGTVTHRLVITNSGSAAGQLDWLDETLPSGASYVSGSFTVNGRAVADPIISGQHLVVDGPIDVPAAGTVTMQLDEQVDATPGVRTSSAVAYFGTVQIDGSRDVRASDPATASVRVLGNQGPTAVGDSATTSAGAAVQVPVTTNDSSPSGLPLTVTAVSTPAHGTATIGDSGSVVYAPANNISGSDSFTYTVSDGNGTATATVNVTVTPTASNDIYATGKSATLTASTSVLSNDACTSCAVTLVSGPTMSTGSSNGTLTLNSDGTFTYVPPASTSGTATFTYRGTNGAGDATATVTINVSDLAPDYVTTSSNTAVDINVKANDPACSSSGCKPQIGTAPGRGAVDYSVVTPLVRYTPTNNLWGLDSFTYGVTGSSGSTTTPVTVLVGPPALSLTTSFDTAASHALPTGGSCSGCAYSVRTPAAHGEVSVNTGTGAMVYTPAAGFAGTDSFEYRVQDPATGLRVPGSVSVTVGPSAGDDTLSVLAGNQLSADVGTNDDCPATCTWTLSAGAPSGMSLSASGTLTWTPSTTILGAAAATYTIVSSLAPSYTATGHIAVDVNGAADDTASTPVGTPVTIPVSQNDPCSACTVSAVSAGNVGTTATAPGGVRYTPPAGFSGIDTFTYTVTNGTATSVATVVVTVTPTGVDDSVTTSQNAPVDVLPLANDLCVGCAVTGVGTPGNGEATASSDVVTYSPASGFTGSDSFSYTLSDSSGNATTATITVSVVAPPTIVADNGSGDAGTPILVDVLTNDSCSGCSVSIGSDPAHGSAVVDVHNRVLYQPDDGYTGLDALTYVATDPATGAQASAAVTFDVRPVAVDDSAHTAVGSTITLHVLDNDTCFGACVIDVTTAASHGSTNVTTSAIDYTPDGGYTGTDHFTYRITDPATGDTATAVATVDVNDAAPDATTTAAGTPVSVDVLANDICPGCSVTGSDVATATWNAGTITYTPPANFWGLAVLPYTASNGSDSVSSTLRVLVAPPLRTLNLTSNSPATLTAVGTDCNGCTVALVTPPLAGELDLDASGITYTPEAGCPTDSFSYDITDPVSDLHVRADVNVTVTTQLTPVDDTATATSHGGAISIGVLTNDPVGAALQGIGSAPSHGSVTALNSSVIYTPTPGYVGTDTFTYTVVNGSGPATVTVTVNPSDQTITFTNPGAADLSSVQSVSLSASAPGGTVTFATQTPSVCTVSGTTATLLTTGTCTVAADQSGGNGWNAAPQVPQSFNVGRSQAPQSITFDPPASAAVDGGNVMLTATATSNLPVTISSTTPSVCTVGGSGFALVPVQPGACDLSATQNGDATWLAATPVNATVTITRATQSINFAALTDTVLSAASVDIAPTATSALTVLTDTSTPAVCSVSGSGTSVALLTPGTCTLVASQPGDGYWLPATSVTRSFDVLRNPQAITFSAPTDVAIATDHVSVQGSADSGLIVAFATTTPSVCTVAGAVVTLAGVGQCSITATQPGNTDWAAATPVTRSFQVLPNQQTIDVLVPPTVAGDADPVQLVASATSGLPVSWASDTPNVCTVDGSLMSVVTMGDCRLVASQPGNSRWAAATPVTVTVKVVEPLHRAVDDTVTVTPTIALASAVPIDVLANDGSGLSVVSVTQPSSGKAELVDGQVHFTAAAGFAGTVSFTYTTENSRHEQTSATVTVTVLDSAPTVRIASGRTVSGVPVVLAVTAQDANNDVLSTQVATVDGASAATLDDGVRVAPAMTTTGRLAVTVTVRDPSGETASATGYVLVSPRPARLVTRTLNGVGTTVSWAMSNTRDVSYAVLVDGRSRCVTAALSCSLGEPYGPRAHIRVMALGHDGTTSDPVAAKWQPGLPVLLTVVHFATASAVLADSGRGRVVWVAHRAIELGFESVNAVGYTDSRGSASYNLRLSHRRVMAVTRVLHATEASLGALIGWKGLTHPAKTNATAVGRAANRRVEIWAQ